MMLNGQEVPWTVSNQAKVFVQNAKDFFGGFAGAAQHQASGLKTIATTNPVTTVGNVATSIGNGVKNFYNDPIGATTLPPGAFSPRGVGAMTENLMVGAATDGATSALGKTADVAADAANVALPYKQLSKELAGTGAQAHHLSQDAVYGDVIPKDQGLAVPMPGNAITDVGSAHYDVHAAMEGFWDQYRPGGSHAGELPSNAEYMQAMQDSLTKAGVPEETAKKAMQEAAAQQKDYGLQPNDPIPSGEIPNRLNQVQPTSANTPPTTPPNAPPVPAGKSQ